MSVELRVHFAHGLPTQVEQIGVEERQVVVGPVGARHVRARRLAVLDRVVPVLDPHPAVEREVGELRHVPGGVDVGIGGAGMLVHLDAVADLEPGGFRQIDRGRDAGPTSWVVTMLPVLVWAMISPP